MSQASPNPQQEELQNFSWLLESWAHSLVGAVKGMGCADPSFDFAGEPEPADPTAAAAPPAAEGEPETAGEPQAAGEAEPAGEATPAADLDTLWWGQSFNLHAAQCVWAGAEEAARKQIGRQALIAAGLEEPEDPDIDSTFQEIVVQSMSGLAARLTARCGKEVTSLSGLFLPKIQVAGIRRLITLKIAEDVSVTLTFVASAEFLQQLMRMGFYRETGWIARDQRSGDRQRRVAREAAAAREEPEQSVDAPQADALPFDSVLDMDIPVSISFGTAKLRLDEALKLREGSVVVLNRTIDELVELQVNGRVVARGEVVAVRGQYGIRIQELSSRGERMDQLDPKHRPEIEASLNA